MSHIPLETAKALIIEALDGFDPVLSACAANILYDGKRLNIVEESIAKTQMMQCRPAGMTNEFLKATGMYKPDFEEQYGPHFTTQENLTDHAIVDFEYDGRPQTIIWLAHELGHAIADDVQNENGHSFNDFSMDEAEEQAYFVQHVVSQFMKDNLPQYHFQDEDLVRDPLAMSCDRAKQYIHAGRVFDNALAHADDERAKITLRALDPKITI